MPEATKIKPPTTIFQAIGIITGLVTFAFDETKNKYIAKVAIGQHEYNLLPRFGTYKAQVAFAALRKEIESTGNNKQKLIVYPKVAHYPGRDRVHRMAFQLVSFEKTGSKSLISDELDNMEFKLAGMWQFIPVCKTPCVTILRNFTDARLEYIKKAALQEKVRFMKAAHIPLIWRDAVASPVRFNPKASKDEQSKASFIAVKARFIPGQDVFGFSSLDEILQEPPRHLKSSKKDKAKVLKAKLESRKTGNPGADGDRGNSGVKAIDAQPKVQSAKTDRTPGQATPKPKIRSKRQLSY